MTADKLHLLRVALTKLNVQGFVVPNTDEFLGEYIHPSRARLTWLTGFTGSAGTAVVLKDKAAFFTDGRYSLQAAKEVDAEHFAIFNMGEQKLEDWVKVNIGKGEVLGLDPRLHTESFMRKLAKAGVKAEPLVVNPIDELWQDSPPTPQGKLQAYAESFAGESSALKRKRVGEEIDKAGADAALITAGDSIMWLLNVRGQDLEHSPIALCYALLETSGRATLFIDPAKMSAEVVAHLGNDVAIVPLHEMTDALVKLGKVGVLLDSAATPAWFAQTLKAHGTEIVEGKDPCELPKACKNSIEIAGMRSAHLRDGRAVVRFLSWLTKEAAAREVSELEIADKILQFRSEEKDFFSTSFSTIAGSGPNGAIVHYRATEASHRSLKKDEILLLDSGAQYLDGTTDITRTIINGTPTKEMKARFTLVLKGHIALGSAKFPKGTSGGQLDALARHALWDAGLDFDHGTGHGVGAFLNVHEGPQRISKRYSEQELKPGMIISNEPGYYKTAEYGIRIESLIAVKEAKPGEDGKVFYDFETLTLVPIDRNLIAVELLSSAEKEWLNAYHARVFAAHEASLNAEEKAWLKAACAALA